MPYEMILREKTDQRLYLRSVVARIAQVTPDFLSLCEQENLIETQILPGGESGFSEATIRQLIVIRRLHHELDLDLETIDLVLHLRCQVLDLRQQLAEQERQARWREQTLVAEIVELRQKLFEGQPGG